MKNGKQEGSDKKKPEKHDLNKNPDKYRVRIFDPSHYERVLQVFPNGSTGWVERRKS